jgi:hypothetical protein
MDGASPQSPHGGGLVTVSKRVPSWRTDLVRQHTEAELHWRREADSVRWEATARSPMQTQSQSVRNVLPSDRWISILFP